MWVVEDAATRFTDAWKGTCAASHDGRSPGEGTHYAAPEREQGQDRDGPSLIHLLDSLHTPNLTNQETSCMSRRPMSLGLGAEPAPKHAHAQPLLKLVMATSMNATSPTFRGLSKALHFGLGAQKVSNCTALHWVEYR